MTGKLTLACRQQSVPEVTSARDRSKRSVDIVAVLELKSGVARGVGNQPITVNVVDCPPMLQIRQVRTPWSNSCKQRYRTNLTRRPTEILCISASNLLKRLTTPHLQVLPIPLTVYISYLPTLLRDRGRCQLVRYNCTKTLLLIDACLDISSHDFMFLSLLCVLLISLFILPCCVCVCHA